MNDPFNSPWAAFAGQAATNLTNMGAGRPVVSPIQAYQTQVMRRAQMNQRMKEFEEARRLRDLQIQKAEQDLTAEPELSLGQYNPRDYTTESWSQFLETKDPSVLQRYDPFTQANIRYARGPDGQIMPVVDPQTAAQLGADQAAQIKSATEFASNQEAWRANQPKLLGSIDSAKSKAEVVSETVADIMPLLNEWTTGYGSMLSALPETEARRLSNLLDTIKANVAFTTLQDMRANSPTGGALGQVSERELDLLMSALGSLDAAGSMDDLRKVLQRIERANWGTLDRLERAYELDRQRYNPDAEPTTDDFEGWSIERAQ